MSITAAMLPALLGRPVAYQPVFTKLPGVSVQGAIFLSQALFLCNTPTAQRRGGWFWKEQQGDVDSWEAETGMSAKQQQTARRQLVAIGVLEEIRKGVPAKTWYRVDLDRLAQVLAEALGDDESPASPHGCPVSPNGRNSNRPSGESRIYQTECTESPERSFHTETTTENNPPPSDAGESNGESIFEQAARSADDGTPPPTAFEQRQHPMTYGWLPDTEQLAMACYRRGLPTDTAVPKETLADFTAHFAEKPTQRLTGQGWHERLAKWLAENRQRPLTPNATGNAAQGDRHADRRAADTGRDQRTERQLIADQLSNPQDTSWADGWWPEDDTAAGADAGAGQPGVHPARGDFSEDLGERVPECGSAQPGPAGAGAGAGPVAGATDPANGRAGDEQFEAGGEYLAADDPGVGLDASAYPGGLRHADDW